ncbi:MAG: trehalose-6-phosphate synthase [Deltaproteobacteria bacterium RBG_13_58_19]|nr:MAG: trehalose-6-phosphate synthase [Deltaproteobacteria bacterium RBG_13_58_19]
MVSNREPYMHIYRGAEVEVIMPASGMAIALDAMMQACGGTWIASGTGEADQEAIAGRDTIMVPPHDPKYQLHRLWLTREEEIGYYYGFSNEALWPLCHIAYTRPNFSPHQWEIYKSVNRKFADAVLSQVGQKRTIVFIQDYHFALLPRMLKEADPGLAVCQFWHIPWPNYEAFRICPWANEILEGLLGNDLLGFHLQYHCNNFFDTVERSLEARTDYEKFAVIRHGNETWVRPFPISIDFARFSSLAASSLTQARMAELRHQFKVEGIKVGLGVDRLDYTKGIPERLQALDLFFTKYPQYQGRFTFIQLGPQSRLRISQYKDLNARVDALEEEINSKYGWGRWKPLVLFKTHLSQEEIVPFYRLADVMVVSSLHDGLNLVAKEYVASRVDGDGALLLSPFTGAARELTWAYTINPYNPEEIADAIYKALEDPLSEKAANMEAMRAWVREHNIYNWAAQFLQTLAHLPRED